MAQSPELASEIQAMRRIEAAFDYVGQLTAAQQRRVRQWAREEYLEKPVPAVPESLDTAALLPQASTKER